MSSLLPLGIERHLVKFLVAAIHEPDGHLLRLAVDVDQPEELETCGWRQILALLARRRFHKLDLGPKGHVEIIGTESSGMDGAGDEFPEGRKILEPRFLRRVVVRTRIMNVCR